jgi:hypothetical protein
MTTPSKRRHEELVEAIEELQARVDLAIELQHDLVAWLAAAFGALGVTVQNEIETPKPKTILRIVPGFKGHKSPDGDNAA